MKEINGEVLSKVSGGNLTSCILDFIHNWVGGPNAEKGEWTSNSTIESPALGKGEEFGKAIVTGGLAVLAVATGASFALFGGIFSLFNRK
ncbi:hypothetical protein [Enterobacter sp. CC120223-11]|uniref:hypothetical protein n=1 Tax=Enterobacter sp. CC120223-11 TaxID=1378073 RepID=UPI000BCA6304|nr:hypothetical protein [Enterobacter sp. CC120223-11]SNY61437.1 hypothetical protein SAMN02744775_00572 [Enterobacter sp. CC120223-11]